MNLERIYQVLLSPYVSEKVSMLADDKPQYAFKVAKTATKKEISTAITALFKVEVLSVRTLNVKAKTVRTGRRTGSRSGWRKAYVTLQAGQEIDLTEKVA